MSAGEGPVLRARGVGVTIGSAELLREVDLDVHPGFSRVLDLCILFHAVTQSTHQRFGREPA